MGSSFLGIESGRSEDHVYPHCDSNAGFCLRRATLYPLSYGGERPKPALITAQEYTTDLVFCKKRK